MKHFIRCDVGCNKAEWLYLIPTIKITCSNKFLEVEFDILLLTIYWIFSIGNYDKE